jgi:hypothetical protein
LAVEKQPTTVMACAARNARHDCCRPTDSTAGEAAADNPVVTTGCHEGEQCLFIARRQRYSHKAALASISSSDGPGDLSDCADLAAACDPQYSARVPFGYQGITRLKEGNPPRHIEVRGNRAAHPGAGPARRTGLRWRRRGSWRWAGGSRGSWCGAGWSRLRRGTRRAVAAAPIGASGDRADCHSSRAEQQSSPGHHA